jgi:outer membrane protein assembly factor BamD (BamD/ComL family)
MPGNPGGIEGDVDQVGVSDFGNRPQLQDEQDITLQTLESNLPLTDEALKASDEKIENALFNQAMIYKNQLEDYAQASEVLEEILRRFPQTTKEDSILSALIYTQKKAGNKNRSAQYAEMQIAKYPDSKTRLSDLQKEKADPAQQNAPYENILELFKAGQYEAAMFAKKMADSTYGNQYWTPQLLYLEALGYLHKKEDSLALVNASYIESNYAGTEMAVKASTLKDVIQRKNEIIGYLQGTDIQKEEEKILEIPYEERPTLQHAAQAVIPRNRLPVITAYPFMKFALKRPVSGIEAVVHNLQRKELLPYNSSMRLTTPVLQPLMPLKTEKIDMIYVYNTSEPYQLLMVFEPMDQVYRNEAKIAIQRHHNTTRGGQDLTVKLYEPEKENAWMEIGSFASLGSAMGYYDETAPNMSKIIPWLNPGKYQWLIISDSNLEILKNRKDISEYLLFIRQYVKGKF